MKKYFLFWSLAFASNLQNLILMVIYSRLLSRWQEWNWQWGSTFACHHVGMLCLRSPTEMVRMLDTFRGLYGPCSWHWGIASPRFSSVSRGCFVGTHTFGLCGWSSTRGQRPIIFAASVTWSRLPHRGGHSREAWERLHVKLWCYYDMKQRNKWSNHSTATSQAAPEKELKLS
jgi:hypothetical protein